MCPGIAASQSTTKDDTGCHVPTSSVLLLRLDQLIRYATLPNDRSVTIMMFSLFTGTEHHGMLLCESKMENYQSLYLASLQTGAALKYIHLLERQEEMMDTISFKNEMLQMLSTQDELTHIFNRRGFIERMQQALRDNAGCDAALFYMDLDCLKTINDIFGHNAGDRALRTLLQTILPTLHEHDLFGRMGGDEFITFRLLPSFDVEPYVCEIREAFRSMNQKSTLPYLINESIGVRIFVCGSDVNLHDLIQDADTRLYQDKQCHIRNALRAAQPL